MTSSQCIFTNDPTNNLLESGLCAFADRVPKVKLSKNQNENNSRVRARNAIVKTLDYMLKHTGQAESIWDSVQSELATTIPAPEETRTIVSTQDKEQIGVGTNSIYIGFIQPEEKVLIKMKTFPKLGKRKVKFH